MGLDYIDTFSLVVKPTTIHVVFALAVHYNWCLHQLDVTNAFLHGLLNEEIYMCQPQGFVDPCFPNHICKLHKSLYGLKQVPRAWYDRFSNYLEGLGLTKTIDSSLFVRSYKGTITIILLYVDDLIITGNNRLYVDFFFISQLNLVFEMKNLGCLHHFLGIEVNRSSSVLFLSQTKYARDL